MAIRIGRVVGVASAAVAGLALAVATRAHDAAGQPAAPLPRNVPQRAPGGGLHIAGIVIAAAVLVAVAVAWVLVTRRLRRR